MPLVWVYGNACLSERLRLGGPRTNLVFGMPGARQGDAHGAWTPATRGVSPRLVVSRFIDTGSTMNLERLYAILADTTVQLRTGPEVTREQVGILDITHVYAMPHVDQAPPDLERVDVVFMVIGVHKARAEAHRAELLQILATYPEPERLAGGPSYIELGAVIGDQGAALQLFALGAVLGLWTVITPRTLGFDDEASIREMAGSGLVMMSGFKDADVPRGTPDSVGPVGRSDLSDGSRHDG